MFEKKAGHISRVFFAPWTDIGAIVVLDFKETIDHNLRKPKASMLRELSFQLQTLENK